VLVIGAQAFPTARAEATSQVGFQAPEVSGASRSTPYTLPPDDVTFNGTTRRWEFNDQHWARIDWKQPDINLQVEGLAADANCQYAI